MNDITMKIATPMAFAALLLIACSSEPSCVNDSDCDETESSAKPDEAATEVEVEYLGGTTDEALAHLTDVTPEVSDEHQLVLDAPTADELSRDTPSTFTFHVEGEQGRLQRGTPHAAPLLPRWLQRAGRDLAALVGPIRSAHAHGTPFNGNGFHLQFRDAKGKLVSSAFTADGTYTPKAATWKALSGAKQPLTLHIDWAEFEENEVVQDGGPFVGLEFEFSIGE